PTQLANMKKKVLVVDIGGTNVKLLMSLRDQRKFASGPRMKPKEFVAKFKEAVKGWNFNAISIGFPAPVRKGRIVRDPKHLGKGWVGYNFHKALRKPVHVINDAAMQALGSYRGGRMLFLGLGTGLGSALIIDGALEPMELAHLPYKHGRTFEEYVGVGGGNARKLRTPPPGSRLGDNDNAFLGGFRLWNGVPTRAARRG